MTAGVSPHSDASRRGLRRSLGLTQVVLYGLGVTIGAGIYVLIGPAAERAGMSAPLAFVLAAIVMGLTGASSIVAPRMPRRKASARPRNRLARASPGTCTPHRNIRGPSRRCGTLNSFSTT